VKATQPFLPAIVLTVLLLLIAAPGTTAQATARGESPVQPRAALLNSDDAYWDDQFASLGVNGTVCAVATSGTDVYVVGNFTTAGGVMANGIAKWDGSTWSALGNGLGSRYPSYAGTVCAIAVSGSDVYVGGYFATAGGVSANNIARWNGSTNSWSALGSGVDGNVSAIAVSGSDVYVGGYFWIAGGVPAQGIAKWDASTNTWSALGSGLRAPLVPPTPFTLLLPAPTPVPTSTPPPPPSPPPPKQYAYVYAIALSGSDVYVGGYFTTAGGVSASNIAKWNGATNTWSALGSGVIGTVRAIVVSGSAVYVGGSFSSVGGITAGNIASWDSSSNTWSALGNGIAGTVNALTMSGSNVYAAGGFSVAGSVSANGIARWDGSAWSALSSGIAGGYYSPVVYAIGVSGSNLYAGGEFTLAGGNPANHVARWDGGGWSALGSGANNGVAGKVSAIVVSGSEMYVGGSFTAAGNARANNIAKWNGATHTWSGLGNGVETKSGYFPIPNKAAVLAIAANGNDVYVGGGFNTAGGVSANNIAKWNATTNNWAALGDGVGGTVNAIVVSGSDVYVGGRFPTVNGMSVSRIAKWNESTHSWSALGTGVGGYYSPSVNAIAVSGSHVYVGGDFVTAGNVSARGIAKWNASTNSWSAVGGGVDDAYGSVNAIVISGSDVYVGGSFNSIGGVSARNIAKWNGNTWSALGSGVGGTVSALATSGSALYVGGYFSTAGSGNASNIAVWNGCGWWALGSGTNSQVSAIAVSGSDVYVGGNFTTAGAKPSSNFGRWSKPPVASNCFYYYFPFMPGGGM